MKKSGRWEIELGEKTFVVRGKPYGVGGYPLLGLEHPVNIGLEINYRGANPAILRT